MGLLGNIIAILSTGLVLAVFYGIYWLVKKIFRNSKYNSL